MLIKDAFASLIEAVAAVKGTSTDAQVLALCQAVQILAETLNAVREGEQPIYVIDPYMCYMPDLQRAAGITGSIVRLRRQYWDFEKTALLQHVGELQTQLDALQSSGNVAARAAIGD